MRLRPVSLYLPSLRAGGAERVTALLANGLSRRGYNVDLVLTEAVGPYLSLVDHSVRILDLGTSRVAYSLPGLIRYLRRERPLALLSALNYANLVAIAAHRMARTKCRLVISVHNTVSQQIVNARTLKERLVSNLMARAYPLADRVVAVSHGVRNDLISTLGLPPAVISVIYNPVVDEQLLQLANELVTHPWFGPGEPPVILGVGRLTYEKDFATLIRAVHLVRRRREVRLLILGEGSLRQELEALVRSLGLENSVQLPGFVDNPYKFMRRAAIFVLSSRSEGLPTALIEAMACGTPVISTDCPSGPAEILENGRWGRLVPVGNAEALADAILAVLAEKGHPDVRVRARDFGVEKAVDDYIRVSGLGY